MGLPVATVIRFNTDSQGTSGHFLCGSFQSFSLELPWNNNINNFSCIPPGSYHCTYTKSAHLHKYTYEVQSVAHRAGIRIHSGNWAGDKRLGFKADVLGCFLLCKKIVIPNGGQRMGIVASNTVKAFETYMNKQDFILNVSWLAKE